MSDERVTAELRRIVSERALACCEYCGSQTDFSTQALAVEHIVPRIKGGQTTSDNLALSCQGCNNHKYDKTEGRDPASGQLAPLYHPRQEKWSEHFTWNSDCSSIIGTTPTGRATVATLCLNRKGLINLRRLLYETEKHPPENFPKT